MQPDPENLDPVVSQSEYEPPALIERKPFWNYVDLALVLGLLVGSITLIILVVGVIALFIPSLRTNPTPLLLPTQFALYGFIYLSFRLIFRTRYGRPVFPSLGWKRTGFSLALTILGGVLLAIALSAIAALLNTPKVDSPIEELAKDPVTFVFFGIMAVSIAPLFEEMFFRGFLQPLLSRSLGVAAGILLTAVLFGALHAPEYSWAWQYGFAVGVAGAVFGWLRARTDSIIPSTIMHGAYNAVFVVAFAFSKHA